MPAFAPVSLRGRADGWTPAKQAAFLAALAVTGSVSAAVQRVGMSRESAYRLRQRKNAASFAHAWDVAMRRKVTGSRKVTADELATRALFGLLKPLIHAGRHVATVLKPDNSALLRYWTQTNRAKLTEAGSDGDVGSFAALPGST